MNQTATTPKWYSQLELDRKQEAHHYRVATNDESFDPEADERAGRPLCFGSYGAHWAFAQTSESPCEACHSRLKCAVRCVNVMKVIGTAPPSCFGTVAHDSRRGQEDKSCNGCRHNHHCGVALMVMRAHHTAEQLAGLTPEPGAVQVPDQSTKEVPAANDSHQMIAAAVTRGLLETSTAPESTSHPLTAECAGGDENESSDTPAEAPYAFPTDDPEYGSALSRFRSMSTPDLLTAVSQLRRLVSRGGVTDYAPHRMTVCAAAIAMNERGSGDDRCPAPAFRWTMPRSQTIGAKIISAQDGILASDRRVVDLHWLALNGRPEPREEFRELFIDGGLNWNLANEFAASRGSAEAKGKLLGLDAQGELPLGMVQSGATRKRWAALCRSRDSALRKIRDTLGRPNTRTTDDAELLWDIFAAHELTGGVSSHIVDLVLWMGHGEVRKEQVARKTKWLRETAGLPLTAPAR